MQKIINTFGSIEAGQAFALSAYDHLILRLELEDNPNNTSIDSDSILTAQVHTGVVVSAALSEPKADSLPHPVIGIAPHIQASFSGPRRWLEEGDLLSLSHARTEPGTNLLIKNPVTDQGAMESNLRHMFDEGAQDQRSLTIARTPLVRATMLELNKLAYAGNPHARLMLTLSRAAIDAVWG